MIYDQLGASGKKTQRFWWLPHPNMHAVRDPLPALSRGCSYDRGKARGSEGATGSG